MGAPSNAEHLQGLLDHGDPTGKQREAVEAVIKHGSHRGAAIALNRAQSNIAQHIGLLKKKAARKGYAPEHGLTNGTASGFSLKGYSHLTKTPEGEPIWLKTDRDKEQQEQAFRAALDAAKESIPRSRPARPPQKTEEDLCSCYVISDIHIGGLVWGEETRGTDWDSDIAEQTIMRWMEAAIESSPKARTAVLAQLGDALHHDGLESITPSSGHVLDADTRFQRLVRIAVRVLRRCIHLMLLKHHEVRVIMAEGNHDMASSVWLREIFAALYEDEPRVSVDVSPDPYYCVEFGKTSLFFHHSHKAKMDQVSRVFAGKFREVFGRTTYSYGHTGHLHHTASKEDSLMIVEQHPTLAPNDAYASRAGHKSQSGARVITYHRRFGEVGRSTIRPEMVMGGGNAAA